jgi:hypothetical protein
MYREVGCFSADTHRRLRRTALRGFRHSETPGDSVVCVRVSFAIEADVMTVGFDWLLWLLVGALGGLLALLSAVAVANSYSGDPRVDRPLLQPELMHQDTSGASRDRTDRTPPPRGTRKRGTSR